MNLFKELSYMNHYERKPADPHLAGQANVREWHFSSRKLLQGKWCTADNWKDNMPDLEL